MGQRGDFRGLAAAVRLGVVAAACLALANCSSRVDPHLGVSASPRVVGAERAGAEGRRRLPRRQALQGGRTAVCPGGGPDYSEVGLASWYGDDFRGRLTANGEVFDNASLSAASPVLPMPCYARVTNLRNGRSIIVRVNDRGPYAANRIVDVSEQTAKILGFHGRGLAKVRVDYVGRAPLEGSDDRMLMATLRENGPAPAPSRIRLASARSFAPLRRRLERQYDEAPLARRQIAAAAPRPSESRELTPRSTH